MDISKFLLTLVMISRLLMNSKLQPSVASHSSQPDFNIYVPNEVTLQLSRLNYKGTLCRRSLPSRVYCLQACLRDCVGLGNELAMYKMRCLLGRKKSSTRSLRMENHLTCKCYYSQRKKVHKNRGKKCLASTNSWDNVQDFFLKSYMNRTDCIPSSSITDLKSSCGRIIFSMSNATNIYNSSAFSSFNTVPVENQTSSMTSISITIEKTVITTVTVETTKKASTTTTTTVEQTTQGFTTQLPLSP